MNGKRTGIGMAVVALGLLAAYAGEREREWDFGNDAMGSVPKGWKVAETHGRGTPATWAVVEDRSAEEGRALAITANKNQGGTFNLLLAEGTSYQDLEIEVKVKAIAGKEDQGGGPIWRAKDADNYYVCRWNPLEDNIRLYTVKDGHRKQLASATLKVDTSVWHEIKIEQVGDRIEVEFDGRKVIDFKDSTFPGAGMVGLWVKADGRSRFDEFEVSAEDDDD